MPRFSKLEAERLRGQELEGQNFDITIVGSGPPALALAWNIALNHHNQKVLVVEMGKGVGGGGLYSQEQSRTLHDHILLSRMTAETDREFEARRLSRSLPYVFAATSADKLKSDARHLRKVQRWDHGAYGKGAEVIKHDELRRRHTHLDGQELVGAVIYPAHKLDYTGAIMRILDETKENTTYSLNTAMLRIIVENGRATKVKTTRGTVSTGAVVIFPGPFVNELPKQIEGGEIDPVVKFSDIFTVQQRQTFTAPVDNMPPDLFEFDILNGAYARFQTDNSGKGMANYGFADPKDRLLRNPRFRPRRNTLRFELYPLGVYKLLSKMMHGYADVSTTMPGSLARKPTSHDVWYYIETPDGIPVISKVNGIGSLYLGAGFGHAGVMESVGAATRMAGIIFDGRSRDEDALSLGRNFKQNSHSSRL